MAIKNRTHFALIAGVGLSLFSGLSHTAFAGEDKIINEHGENIGKGATKEFGVEAAKEIRELGEFAVMIGGGIQAVTMAYHGAKSAGNGISNVYYFFWPTVETQNKDFAQRVFQAYNICLTEHLTPEDGVKGIPYACTGYANQLNHLVQQKMAIDAMKMGEATQSVEKECLRQNPLAEDIVRIPSACKPQFNALKTAVDAMEVRKDTIQN